MCVNTPGINRLQQTSGTGGPVLEQLMPKLITERTVIPCHPGTARATTRTALHQTLYQCKEIANIATAAAAQIQKQLDAMDQQDINRNQTDLFNQGNK